jgi:Leucine-rich repeat (LRR) protein
VNLKELWLNENKLTGLPSQITRLVNLRYLPLTGNPLRLSDAQRKWIAGLEANGCKVSK